MANKPRITINVSGLTFKVRRDLLLEKPETYLGRIAMKTGLSEEDLDIWIDRPLDSFQAVLTFYQTGEFHMPPTICPKAFKTELDFWRISYTDLEECCLYRYLQFMDDMDKKSKFLQQQTKLEIRDDNGKRRVRSKIWSIIDNREKSIGAKIFLFVGISFVLASAITMSINTLPQHRRFLTPCEMQKFYKDDYNNYVEEEIQFLSVPCSHIRIYDDRIEVQDVEGNFTKPDSLPTLTIKNEAFMTIEYITTTFFTVELFFRLLCCPSLKVYFMSWINLADIISLIAGYMTIVVYAITENHQQIVMKDVLEHLQVLRLLRLVRYCQHFSTIQVLKFSMKQNFRDLLVLLLYLGIGILIFANIIYLVEDNSKINNIPQAWWLGIITMTTVGYGDVTPVTPTGKAVCGICAIGGVILISVILPIFVDSFLSLYGIAQLNLTSYRKQSHGVTVKTENAKVTPQKIPTISWE
ncbi:unnamed protein product [Mytilus coruscus]|uniref:KCNC1 n=1 Tax=Mytilus coruscus TaxID=42192 RepID=A0A6J8F2V6_MYTCO|nr:unnamed protein product [Mytilus coruscus]